MAATASPSSTPKTIAAAAALQTHAQYYIGYNRTLDELVAIDAYTHKRDGRRVAVLPEHIKDQQEAASNEAPLFQDTRLRVIVFPDVEVGDQLVVRYVLHRHTALFPGHFEDLSASQFYANPQFHLIYDMPASVPLHADAAGFAALASPSPAGRTRYHWHYQDGPNARLEADSVSYLDYGKRLAVSTFPDYRAFAAAYAARARDKAQVTRPIAVLAADLTRGLHAPRARALALADWVRRHIRYVAVYAGAGGVVPHPAATVLASRYGDCKDHAVLLEALLRAAGIASTAVLLNHGNSYRLPEVPGMGIFNHVINFIPALDLYLDTTAGAIAPGYLPAAVMDKPALLIASGTLARTPARQNAHERSIAWFDVHADGAGTFSVARITAGAMAEPYRQAVRETPPAERTQLARQLLQGLGQQGRGVFDAGQLDGEGDEYRMHLTGSSDNVVSLPGPVGVATSFNFWGGLGDTILGMAQEPQRSQDFVCPAIEAHEETGFRFPQEVAILALPRALDLNDGPLRYSARYLQQGNAVTVTRSLRFEHEGMVCRAREHGRMQALLERMLRDLRAQIIVQAP
jgi:transglutaminase-like putative cysteine protease